MGRGFSGCVIFAFQVDDGPPRSRAGPGLRPGWDERSSAAFSLERKSTVELRSTWTGRGPVLNDPAHGPMPTSEGARPPYLARPVGLSLQFGDVLGDASLLQQVIARALLARHSAGELGDEETGAQGFGESPPCGLAPFSGQAWIFLLDSSDVAGNLDCDSLPSQRGRSDHCVAACRRR